MDLSVTDLGALQPREKCNLIFETVRPLDGNTGICKRRGRVVSIELAV